MKADLRDEARHRDAFVLGRRLVSCPEADLPGGLDRLRVGRDAMEIFGLMPEEHRRVLVHLADRVWFHRPRGVQMERRAAQPRVRLLTLLRRERMVRQSPAVLPASELWERARRPGCLPELRDALAWSQNAPQPVDRAQEQLQERRAAWPRQ